MLQSFLGLIRSFIFSSFIHKRFFFLILFFTSSDFFYIFFYFIQPFVYLFMFLCLFLTHFLSKCFLTSNKKIYHIHYLIFCIYFSNPKTQLSLCIITYVYKKVKKKIDKKIDKKSLKNFSCTIL